MLNFLEKPASAVAASQLPKTSDDPLDKYLLNIDKLIKQECETPEAKVRAQTIIQMSRRYRGTTPSDLFGFWRNGVWAESPRFANLQGTNIFQALVHGAESGYMQARIALDISAKANNFNNRSVEKIARSIYEVLNRDQWNSLNESAVFQAAILKLNAYCISRFNKAGGPQLPSPSFSPISYQQGGMWICPNCYAHGEYMPGMDTCPECGSPVSVVQDPSQIQDYIVSQFGSVAAGEVETIIADGLDVSVDDRDGRSADVESCWWVQWRYFAQKGELKKLYPYLKLEHKPEWSYTTRLKTALKRYESGEALPKNEFDKNTYEVKQTWLDYCEYEDYVAPASFQLGNFSIKQGQKLTDVCPDGLVMGVVNNELAFIDNEDKNRRVKSCVWLADPTSFYGLGARAGLAIQKKINQLDNMAMEGEARSLKGAVIYNPEAVDGANLEGANTNIPLRPDFSTGGEPIKNFLMPLDVSGLSQASMMFLSSQVATMQKVMGIPDVTLGEGDQYSNTATGQQLINQRATGLLVPAKKSEGQMKAGWLMDQLDIIQKFYSPTALLTFGARYGEEWLDDEVQAFLNCKLKDAITVEVVEGSEVPESKQDKQMKLRQDIMAGFIPMTPELQSKLAQQSGYDGVDVNGYESNHKLAQKRLNFIKENIATPQIDAAYQQMELALMDRKTGQRAVDPAGNPVPNPILQQLMANPVLQVNRQAENHQQMFDFWSAKTREFLSSGSQVPQVLIAACDYMMTASKGAAFAEATTAQALAGLAQAPMQVGGMLAGHAMNPPEETADKNTSQNNNK